MAKSTTTKKNAEPKVKKESKAKKEPKAKKEKKEKKETTKAKKETTPKESKTKKEKPPKEPKPFAHDPRVLPFVGQTLKHTERDGTVHELKVLEDGFEMNGERYNSATAAAKPLQPVVDGKSRAVNGLVYWNIVKTPRAAISPEEAALDAQKAIDKALERAGVAVEAAGDKKGAVRRALEGAVKKLEKLIEGATATATA